MVAQALMVAQAFSLWRSNSMKTHRLKACATKSLSLVLKRCTVGQHDGTHIHILGYSKVHLVV